MSILQFQKDHYKQYIYIYIFEGKVNSMKHVKHTTYTQSLTHIAGNVYSLDLPCFTEIVPINSETDTAGF